MEKQMSIFDPLPMSEPIPKLNSLPLYEQPAQRYLASPDACNLVELISVILGDQNQIEIAEKLLSQFGSVQNIDHASICELENGFGLNQEKALRLKAALTMGRRLLQPEPNQRQKVTGVTDVANILGPMLVNQVQEYIYVLLLDTRLSVVKTVEVYHGSADTISVRIAELLMPAIKVNATNLIMAHNHPSGNEQPSGEDLSLTRELVKAGKLMSIDVLDHIVFGSMSHVYSMKEKNPEVFTSR